MCDAIKLRQGIGWANKCTHWNPAFVSVSSTHQVPLCRLRVQVRHVEPVPLRVGQVRVVVAAARAAELILLLLVAAGTEFAKNSYHKMNATYETSKSGEFKSKGNTVVHSS